MRPRILIVDDEVRMHRLFEINLSSKYEVLTAGRGEEALEIVKAAMADYAKIYKSK